MIILFLQETQQVCELVGFALSADAVIILQLQIALWSYGASFDLTLVVCAVIWARQEGDESFPSVGWQQDGGFSRNMIW